MLVRIVNNRDSEPHQYLEDGGSNGPGSRSRIYGRIIDSRDVQALERLHMNHKTLLADYKDALATQCWEVVAPLIHDDACFIFSEGTYFGKAAIEAAVRSTFNLIESEHYAIKDVVWTYVHDDSAACTYGFEWSGLINGHPASGTGRGTTVVVRGGDRWQIIHEHLGSQ
jgi:ketosteroid isomerase-like protein